jgi:hypothetical protein
MSELEAKPYCPRYFSSSYTLDSPIEPIKNPEREKVRPGWYFGAEEGT